MDFGDMTYQEAEAAPADSGLFSDFFSAAQDRLGAVLAPMQTNDGPSVGSQLFEAIYQFGAGKVDQARDKAVGAFLMTSEGKKAQRAGISQTVQQYLPYIILAVIGLFLLGRTTR